MALNDFNLILGADIDLSAGDFSFGPDGDTLLTTGFNLLNYRLYRRLVTNPGELLGHPDYGAGLASFVGSPLTQAKIATIAGIVYDQCVLDPAVALIQDVRVSQPPGKLHGFQIDFTVVLSGSKAVIPVGLNISQSVILAGI